MKLGENRSEDERARVGRDACGAYFGKYRVDDTKHVVTHEVAGDLADVYVGQGQERPYDVDGAVLKLLPAWEPGGKQWQGVREFVRAKSSQPQNQL